MSRIQPIPLVLKFKDWPQADRDVWEQLTTKGRLLLDAGPYAKWSEGTHRLRRQGYGEWLSFVARTDPTAMRQPPQARITRARVLAYLVESEARQKPRSVYNKMLSLHCIAKEIAEADDFHWLYLLVRRLRHGLSTDNLKPPIPVDAASVYRWSLTHMTALADTFALRDLRQAIDFRRALLVGFLISCPVRRRAVAGLEISHLDRDDESYSVHFPGALIKGGRDRSYVLPRKLTWAIDFYLDFVRPVLLGGKSSPHFWITKDGTPLRADTLTRELSELTAVTFGTSFRAHAFRHIAATSIADMDPAHVGIIRDVLGHATLDTAYKHYNRATTKSANEKFQVVLKGMWKGGR